MQTRLISRLLALILPILLAIPPGQAATLLPNGEQCFSAASSTSGGTYGPITTLGSLSAGSSYVNGTYTNVPLTGGSGFGALATVSVAGNVVTNVALTNPGSHYAVSDTLSAANTSLGGAGSGFSIPVSSVTTTGTGMLGLLGPITGGTGGTAGTYGGVGLTGGSGSGATANITVSGGAVTAVTVLNPGTGFQVGDVLSAPSGSIGSVSGFQVSVSSVAINPSLAGGSVYFYVPGTASFKSTWFNSDQANIHQNSNPVVLDQNGCAIIYGSGTYRQVLQDSLGNTIWDQLTSSTDNPQLIPAGLSGGTPNAITVQAASFASLAYQAIQFTALNTNTGATTLLPSSQVTPISIYKDTSTGPVPLTGGEIVAGNIITATYDLTANIFHLSNVIAGTSTTASQPAAPQGYLTLLNAANGGPILGASDVLSATSVYYSPYVGNQIPIWNGASYTSVTFAELTLALTSSAQVASTIYDVCVFNNSGNPVLVTGPAWSNSTAGSGARGTGGGSAQISRLNGYWVNAYAITGVNGTNSYSIPANQCTYVGSIFTDATAGQVSADRTIGQSRKFGIWNAYNRQRIFLQVQDPTTLWAESTGTWHAANSNSANSINVFTGLPEEVFSLNYFQSGQFSYSGSLNISFLISFGINTTSSPNSVSTSIGFTGSNVALTTSDTINYGLSPSLGINTITALTYVNHATGANATFVGAAGMLLTADYKG